MGIQLYVAGHEVGHKMCRQFVVQVLTSQYCIERFIRYQGLYKLLAVRPILKFLPPANEVCEDYVFTGVCLSTEGVSLQGGEGGLCSGRSLSRETPLYCKERAVRILLECILVIYSVTRD